MKDNTFTYDDLKQFIASKGDEEVLDMKDNAFGGGCGCLLIQFHRTVATHGDTSYGAGYTCVGMLEALPKDAERVDRLISRLMSAKARNYGQVKAIIASLP